MHEILQDVRFAGRSIRRQPGFHALAILTVALGIAATTAVFTVVDGVVHRPLPYPSPDRLVEISTVMRHDPELAGRFAHPEVLMLQERSRSLESLVAVESRSHVVQGEGAPRFGRVTSVSNGFFWMLGARPAVGRLFVAGDHLAGSPPVAVLPYGEWVRRYGGDADVVGHTVRLDDVVHEIVGVVARDFVNPEAVASAPELWTALSLDANATGLFGASVLGRLRPGATVAAANAEVSDLIRQADAESGVNFLIGARVRDLLTATLGGAGERWFDRPGVGSTLWMFLAGTMLLLAIACTNVANLMLVRGTTRAGEFAVRTALGASHGRIARQLLTESVMIALAGGAIGALAAYALVDAFVALGPGGVPRLAEVAVDGRVLAFVLVVSVTTGVLFGIAPALRPARSGPSGILLEAGRTLTSSSAQRLRGTLVVAETAMALVLVLAAGLLVNSFARLRTVDLGFDVDGLVAMRLELRSGYNDRTTWTPFWVALLERVSAQPGIRSTAVSTFMPFMDFGLYAWFTPEGADIPPDLAVEMPSVPISDGWVETLGLRMLEGRAFDGTERLDGQRVILVNQALVKTYWPHERSVVGKRIKSGALTREDGDWYTVIGVVSDARLHQSSDPAPTVYHSLTQAPWRVMSVIARTDGNVAPALMAMRNIVRELDPSLPIRRAGPVASLATEAIVRPRFYSVLSAGFGVLALMLATVGIYGTASYATARRSREIGIRMALGAQQQSVLAMLTFQATRLAMLGVAIGMPVALVAARVLERYLFNVSAADPATYVVTAVIVTLTATAAAWLPARRAAKLDPMTTLRCDT